MAHDRRPIRCVDVLAMDGWRVKLYTIAGLPTGVEPDYLDAARRLAGEILPRPAVAPGRPGAGFVTVHRARMFNQIIVDWWERDNELRHRVFKAPPAAPLTFADITSTGEAFCVWELRIIAFERDAWVETMLETAGEPDLQAYLARRFEGHA